MADHEDVLPSPLRTRAGGKGHWLCVLLLPAPSAGRILYVQLLYMLGVASGLAHAQVQC